MVVHVYSCLLNGIIPVQIHPGIITWNRTGIRVCATGRHYRQMRRQNIFGTKKHDLAKPSGEKKFL